jgi:diphthine-ammonia ligase
MKFIGVISGGKDSILAIHLLVEEGHELVCLANLYPADRVSELDSYMYQCAGTEVIDAIGECFELPLIRRPMDGKPIAIHSNDYEPTDGDEVEDLYLLLKECKERFPDVEGLSTGAVFSNYQKKRVENCCDRLGLVSMAPLWEMPQDRVLDLVEEKGLEAILVKTAFVGLDERHLGKLTSDLRPVFRKLRDELGFNECGEGGEFESITLNCPLFKNKRIELTNQTAIKHGRDCWLLRSEGTICVPK